jgi:hypothetical protein
MDGAEPSGILKRVMAAVHIVNQNRMPIPGQYVGRGPIMHISQIACRALF